MEKDKTNKLADNIVTAYTKQDVVRAQNDLYERFSGSREVCCCLNCKKESLRDFNDWMDWIDPTGNFPRYIMDERGQLVEVDIGYFDE